MQWIEISYILPQSQQQKMAGLFLGKHDIDKIVVSASGSVMF